MGNKRNKSKKRAFDDDERENLKKMSKGSWFSKPEIQEDMEGVKHSLSYQKLDLTLDEECKAPGELVCENYIVNAQVLQNVLARVTVCAQCRSGFLTIKERREARMGIVPDLYAQCSNEDCPVHDSTVAFQTQEKKGHIYDINRRLVLGSRIAGIGETSAGKLLAMLGLPPPPRKWNMHQVCFSIVFCAFV